MNQTLNADTGCNKELRDGNITVAADVALFKKDLSNLFYFLLTYKVALEGNGAGIIYLDSSRIFFWEADTILSRKLTLHGSDVW